MPASDKISKPVIGRLVRSEVAPEQADQHDVRSLSGDGCPQMPCRTRSTICCGSSQTLVAENGMSDRKGNGTQSAGRLCDVQSELILVRFDQRGDHIVEELVIGLLLGSEAVVIMRPPSEAAAIRTV